MTCELVFFCSVDRTVDLFLSFKVNDPELLNPRVEVTVSVPGGWE
jgi:hypothetical protein